MGATLVRRRKELSCDACLQRQVECDATESTDCSECSGRDVGCLFSGEISRLKSTKDQGKDSVTDSDKYNDTPLRGRLILPHLDSKLGTPSLLIPGGISNQIQELETIFNFVDIISFPIYQKRRVPGTIAEACHALVHNLEIANKDFPTGPQSHDEQSFHFYSRKYLETLGVIWLLQVLQQLVQLVPAVSTRLFKLSHWPSYIRHLGNVGFYKFLLELRSSFANESS